MLQTKVCKGCQLEKPGSEFYKDPRGALGLHSRCIPCHRQYYKNNVAKGLCRECGRSRGEDGTTIRCADCSKKARQKIGVIQSGRRASGLCVVCAEQKVSASFCEVCWFKDAARGLGRDRRDRKPRDPTTALWRMLQKKFRDQGGRCALTGELIVIGENAEIDHIMPKSRGGNNDPSNLRWVSSVANVMKWNQTDSELIARCKAILQSIDNGTAAEVVQLLRSVPACVGS